MFITALEVGLLVAVVLLLVVIIWIMVTIFREATMCAHLAVDPLLQAIRWTSQVIGSSENLRPSVTGS